MNLVLQKAAGLAACLALLFIAAGCRSVPEYRCGQFPESIEAPPETVAVFYTPGASELLVFGDCALARERFIPCSTFKIVSTLMGLDSGMVSGKSARLGYDGQKHEYEAWNRDVTLQEAFQASCVWYYKKLVGKLDKSYVQRTLDRLHYGNADISVWNRNGHNVFWIESSLLISPEEQVAVLADIFSGGAGFRPEHVAILRDCMDAGTVGDFRMYGKTGTGRNHNTNFLESWYVGFVEIPGKDRVFFAIHGADPKRNVASASLRDTIAALIRQLGPILQKYAGNLPENGS